MEKKQEKWSKELRIIDISLRIATGEVINARCASERYGTSERTIRRDIEDIRNYYAEKALKDGKSSEVIYEPRQKGYVLSETNKKNLSNGEILAISKILLESRAFTENEMFTILDKIVNGCIPNERKKYVEQLIGDEKIFYIPLQHNKPLINMIWDIGLAIIHSKKIRIKYSRMDGSSVV